MKKLNYHPAQNGQAIAVEATASYKKCYMYRALMLIGEFGVNLLYPEDSFRRWTNRDRKIGSHNVPIEQ